MIENMIVVGGLVWDEWNREHIEKHNVTTGEVEEVCHGTYKVKRSFRKRIQMSGKTKNGKKLVIILSPEDRNFHVYGNGIYYPVTAFNEGDL